MRIITLIIGILGIHPLGAQVDTLSSNNLLWDAALPFITTFTPQEYQAHEQNWCFTQDASGIIYVGNTSGVLEFDGINWRLIKLPNSSPAKSLAYSDDSTIYVGAVRELGRLRPNVEGSLQFESLLSQLDSAYRDFSDIWFTFAVKDTVYFISDKYIFRWHDEAFKVWTPKEFFGFAFQINDQIYVDNRGIGVMEILGDSLVPIPGGDRFLEGGLTTLVPFGAGRLLAANFRDGLFLYDYQQFTPLVQGSRNVLQDQFVYSGKALPNGDIALLTSGNGGFILDPEGQVRQWLNQETGLSSNVLIGGYVDREGSLWLATENGIDRVEISFPARHYTQSKGLTEVVNKCIFHHQRWYAATFNGIFYLDDVSENPEKLQHKFLPVPGINNQTWDMVKAGQFLLAGNFNGLYQVADDLQVNRIFGNNTNTLCPAELHPNQIFAGTSDGDLFILEFTANQWKPIGSGYSLEGRVMEMQLNEEGSLWISTRYNGVYKIDWPGLYSGYSFDQDPTLSHYDTLNGLPDISYNAVFKAHENIYFSTNAGIYQFNPADRKFVPVARLNIELDPGIEGMENKIAPAKDGGIWIARGSTTDSRVYKYRNNELTELLAARRFSDHHVSDIREFGDLLLLSGAQGLVLYNQSQDTGNPPLVTNLRSVHFADSLLFGGHHSRQFPNSVVLPFKKSLLRFSYTLASYQNPDKHAFQSYLEGYDDRWTSWSEETQRDFTNLSEGDYVFRVRSRGLFGQASPETSFAFTILPPWYRAWWAYLGYFLIFMAVIAALVQWRSQQLRLEKAALEELVRERTLKLEEQALQLKEMDRLKTRLFANISHEFRTPLSLIKGPVEEVVQGRKESLQSADATLIDRNANRLLRLVNQLLDMSKLEAGKLELFPEPCDINLFMRVLGAAFSSHAERRGIDYQIHIPNVPAWVTIDKDKLEQVVYNLLSNAFKFTGDGGKVVMAAKIEDQLFFEVKDNGMGIASDQLPWIFDRFYQVETDATYEHEGTGIGLALCKELVNLMNGDIKVVSKPERGSTFTVVLPLVKITPPVISENRTTADTVLAEPPADEQDLHADIMIPEGQSVVLVVEDNLDMRDFIRKQLQDDYQVLEASEGKSGLDQAVELVPDLIVTDLMMPQMDGTALCERVKNDERTSHIPVIMLTAKAGQKHKIKGLETGADDYLTKPFDSRELQVRVKNLIDQRQKLREKFIRSAFDPRKVKLPSLDEKFIRKVMELLELEYSNSDFGVSQMQGSLAVSKTQLHRKIKALTNHSPGEFLRNFRLKKAASMLSQQNENVTQVAYAVGFNNLSYFAKCFKELHGQAPSEFKG